jgi:hypothetical protein
MLELDKTRIAVRERSQLDILDLALRVSRAYAWRLLVAFAAGIVPMMALNAWWLAGLSEPDFEFGFPAQYMVFMVLLVAFEAPLATAPATLYLGKAVFTERPQPRNIAREFRESLPQLLLYQGLLRFVCFRWRYLNEVILLERNPVRRRSPGSESTLERSRVLHRGEGGDFSGWRFANAAVGAVLFASIWFSIFLVRLMLLSRWEWGFDQPMFTLYFPLALWLVVGYFTVVRFLSYLDLRIRREGWEVELLMRAERTRLLKQWR